MGAQEQLADRLRQVLELKKQLVWDIIDMILAGELVAEPDISSGYQNIEVCCLPFRVAAWRYQDRYQASIGWLGAHGGPRLTLFPREGRDGQEMTVHDAYDRDRNQNVCEALWMAMWEQAGRNEATYARHIDYVEQLPEANDAVAVMRAAHDKAMAETKGVDT